MHPRMLLAALLVASAMPAAAQQKQVWKASDVHPLGYPTVEADVVLQSGAMGRAGRPCRHGGGTLPRGCSSAAGHAGPDLVGAR